MPTSKLSGRYITRKDEHSEWSYRFAVSGRPFKGTTGTLNKREAEAFAAQKRADEKALLRNEAKANRGPMDFGRACEIFIAEKVPTLRSEKASDVRTQVAFMQKYIAPGRVLHDIPASAITAMSLARRKMLKRSRGGVMVRIKDCTADYTVDLLHRILNYAHDNHGATVAHYKWATFRAKKERAERGAKTRRALRPEIEQMILSAIKAEYLQVTRFALLTGLRATENLLTWDQIDWQEGVANEVKGKGHRALGRQVRLGRAALAILQAEYERPDRDPVHVFTYAAHRTRHVGNTGRVTIRGQRYPITYTGWNSAWDRMKTTLELQGKVRIHDLRHTFATRNAKLVNVADLQNMMGHAKAETTMGYVSVDDAAIRAALDAMPMPMPHYADDKIAPLARKSAPQSAPRRKAGG